MLIKVVCDSCGTEYNLKEEYAGKKVKCRTCQASLAVPAPVLAGVSAGSSLDLREPEAPSSVMKADPFAPPRARPSGKLPKSIPVSACISREERKKRLGVAVFNVLIWLFLLFFVVVTFGVILIAYASGWIINQLLAEYNVRKLQAYGTQSTEEQFPEISRALAETCAILEVAEAPKVIIVNDSQLNAFAVKFARKKVIVLLSETLEGVIDEPEQLRFFLGHELAHIVIDHGRRGRFEIYKPAAYKAAREMTCDNCGTAAAGSLDAAKVALKRLGVGHRLYGRLNEPYLEAEANYIYSGLTGWFLKQYLTYPPIGKRIMNVKDFSEEVLASY